MPGPTCLHLAASGRSLPPAARYPSEVRTFLPMDLRPSGSLLITARQQSKSSQTPILHLFLYLYSLLSDLLGILPTTVMR